MRPHGKEGIQGLEGKQGPTEPTWSKGEQSPRLILSNFA